MNIEFIIKNTADRPRKLVNNKKILRQELQKMDLNPIIECVEINNSIGN